MMSAVDPLSGGPPSSRLRRAVLRAPIWLYMLGLGRLLGHRMSSRTSRPSSPTIVSDDLRPKGGLESTTDDRVARLGVDHIDDRADQLARCECWPAPEFSSDAPLESSAS